MYHVEVFVLVLLCCILPDEVVSAIMDSPNSQSAADHHARQFKGLCPMEVWRED